MATKEKNIFAEMGHHIEPEENSNVEVLLEDDLEVSKNEDAPSFIDLPKDAPLKPVKAKFTAAILPWCC